MAIRVNCSCSPFSRNNLTAYPHNRRGGGGVGGGGGGGGGGGAYGFPQSLSLLLGGLATEALLRFLFSVYQLCIAVTCGYVFHFM